MRICSLKSGCQLICQIDTIDTRCRSVIRSGLQKGPLSRQIPCVNSRHVPLWMQASRRCIRCLGERSPVLLMLGRRSAGDRPLAIGGCPHLPGTGVREGHRDQGSGHQNSRQKHSQGVKPLGEVRPSGQGSRCPAQYPTLHVVGGVKW